MKDAEFISYRLTPEDPHMLGIVTVRLYGKIVLRYKHLKTKEGSTTFFSPASYGIADGAGKKYIPCFQLDSQIDDEMLKEFVREKSTQILMANNKVQPMASPSVFGSPDQVPF